MKREMKPRCEECKTTLKETAQSKRGQGLLIELRCPKCRMLFYAERIIAVRR